MHGEKCLLLPSRKAADECRAFIERRTAAVLGRRCTARCVEERHDRGGGPFAPKTNTKTGEASEEQEEAASMMVLHVVLFDGAAWGVAKEFWQHTGLGVSSRFAERFLSLLARGGGGGGGRGKMHNRHYSVNKQGQESGDDDNDSANGNGNREGGASELGTYLEERYGRNLPLSVAASAKRALRRRLAGVLIRDDGAGLEEPCAPGAAEVGPSSRGVRDVAEGDVYLFPSGMAAIWTAHQCLLGVGPEAKSVCFGCVLSLDKCHDWR